MMKVNYNILFKGLLISVLTFFAGYFLPENYLDDSMQIFEILLAVFGVILTAFTFIQGVVQNCKSSFLISVKKKKDYLIEKFDGLDCIVGELKKDVLGVLKIIISFGFVMLFLGHFINPIWQEILVYFKYLSLFLTAFFVIDIVLTMFKLVEINAELNKIAIKERE